MKFEQYPRIEEVSDEDEQKILFLQEGSLHSSFLREVSEGPRSKEFFKFESGYFHYKWHCSGHQFVLL
jgi:hypothetical protein